MDLSQILDAVLEGKIKSSAVIFLLGTKVTEMQCPDLLPRVITALLLLISG